MTGHAFVAMEKALEGKMKESVAYCEKHPQQEINSYCLTDKLAICAECAIDFHKGHEVDRLTNTARGFKEEMIGLLGQVFPFFFFSSFFFLFFSFLFFSFFFFSFLSFSSSSCSCLLYIFVLTKCCVDDQYTRSRNKKSTYPRLFRRL